MSDRTSVGFTSEQIETIRAGVRKREATSDPKGMRGVNRIEVDVVGALAYDARNLAEPDAPMQVGEPAERGGTGEGASPLSHFLTGAGACLLNQFVRVAVAEELPITFTRATVRGEFRRESGGSFERIVCEIHGHGDTDGEVLDELTERAERLCYVHATLRRAIAMTTIVVVDGQERVRRVSGPGVDGAGEGMSPEM